LLAATVLWAFMRRRANAVRWVEPPATTLPTGAAPPKPGAPGELPDDVLATDAGLTELPDQAADEDASDTVDESRVAEILVESPDVDVVVVDETTYEQVIADAAPEPPPNDTAALADAAPAHAAAAEAEAVATGPAAAAASEGTSEARLEAALPAVADVESTRAGLESVAPAAAGEESTEAGLEVAAPAGTAADEEATERELAGPEVGETDEEGVRGMAMPTFSEAPTAEIPAVTDDLRAVRGIGPSMERKLHSLGIVSYRQLAMLDGPELERVRGELTDFRGRIERESWVGQARALHREKYGRDPS
jgi:predicted flap endonuclease-1-like 5' DNA nuclease